MLWVVDDFPSNSSSPGHPGDDRALARLASRQHGVVSLAQLESLGLARSTPARPYDVTVVARGRRGPAGIRLHCVRALAPADRTVFSAIAVTSVERAMRQVPPAAA